MYRKVLIAEDHQSLKISVEQTLKQLGVITSKYTYYCDDALRELKTAITESEPFDLLITDLSFEDDHREQILKGGSDLIEAARLVQPNLKIIVFSAESNSAVVAQLFKKFNINGFVAKGRRDAIELQRAIEDVYTNKKHIPIELQQAIRHKNSHDFTSYDIEIISQLANGTLQKDIPAYLLQQGIKAASLSSVEKRLNQIREALGFTKNEQLVGYCKDQKVI